MLAFLRLMGLFDRPASADCIGALLKAPSIPGLTEPLAGMNEAQRNLALRRLEDARLLTVNRDAAGALVSLDAHPLIREYFAARLKWGSAGAPPAVSGALAGNASGEPGTLESSTPPGQPAGARVDTREGARAPQTSDAWRAAHRRLYEHLCATTPDDLQPTLEDLQPLYQAVAHGCQAGLQQEALNKVYHARILRRNESYSVHKLGAFGSDLGAIVNFYDQPWICISSALSAIEQAWMSNEAAYRLRGLGRLTEALEPMRDGLPIWVREHNWREAGVRASNLSELELTLGEVAGAVGDAEQSVTYADRSGDAHMRQESRCTHADALHQAGDRSKSEARFRDAEEMHAKGQPQTPLLYSIRGFRYCDLLLAAPERVTWQTLLSLNSQPSALDLPDVCCSVSQRAAQTLKWVTPQDWLLDIALDHLTLGRAALYAAILERSAVLTRLQRPNEPTAPNADERRSDLKVALRDAHCELDAAVSGLRRAGTQDHLPRGLLTRAWLRFLTGASTGPESAQEDLDEAWEIAERGPMKLFLADIHLHRARLFFREKEYPKAWISPQADLAAAEKIIRHETTYRKPDGQEIKARYARRDEELADAKRAILSPS